MKRVIRKIEKELERTGLILITDKSLPNVAEIVAGEPIQGSWWGHPKGNLIYNLLNELYDREDLLAVKLLNRKLTLVEQRHWPALNSAATSHAPWQTKRLNAHHLGVLKKVQQKGAVRADSSVWNKTPGEIGNLASRLEERLLLYSENVHTESGKHVRQLFSWPAIFKKRKFKNKAVTYNDALMHFELALKDLPHGAKLPWV